MKTTITALMVTIFSGIITHVFDFEYSQRRQPEAKLSYCSSGPIPAEHEIYGSSFIHTLTIENTGNKPLENISLSVVFQNRGFEFNDTVHFFEYLPHKTPEYEFGDVKIIRAYPNAFQLKISFLNPHNRYDAVLISDSKKPLAIVGNIANCKFVNDSTVALPEDIRSMKL